MAHLKVDEVAREKKVILSQLSMDSRVNPSIVARYWHNKIHSVDLRILEALAKALGVQVTDLISNDDPDTQPEQE